MRATSIIASLVPPFGGSSSTLTTQSPRRKARASPVSPSGGGSSGAAATLSRLEGGARSAALLQRDADRLDLGRRRAAAAADDPGAERGRLRRELAEVLRRRVRIDDAAADDAREADVRQRGEREAGARASRASAVRALCGPAPWFVPIAATSSAASRAAASAASTPPAASASSSNVSSATIGSDETAAHRLDRRDEVVDVEERLDHEEVDAAPLEHPRLLGVERAVRVAVEHLELAERADRAGDHHVAAGDVARLAGEADAGRVDRLELVVEAAWPRACAGWRRTCSSRSARRRRRCSSRGRRRRSRARRRFASSGSAGRGRAGEERTHAAVRDDRRAATEPFGSPPPSESRAPESLAGQRRLGDRPSGAHR